MMDTNLVLNTNTLSANAAEDKSKTKIDCMFILGVISTFILLFNIRFLGISLFKFTALGFGTYICFQNQGNIKKSILKYEYIPYFAITFISSFFILAGTSPYKEFTIRSLIDFLFIIYICVMVATCSDMKLRSFFNGVRVSCYVQITWCFIQIAFWYILHVDINKAIFVDGLHLMESVSKYNEEGALCISGISHHPSNLIVVIIFTLFLVKNMWKWPVSVLIAFASRNSTTLIAIFTCILLYSIPSIIKCSRDQKIRKKIALIVVFAIFVLIIIAFSGGGEIADRINTVIYRIQSVYNGTTTDGSTIAHASYYTFLPKVWKRFSPLEMMFGYSFGWTGGMFYYFFGAEYSLIYTRPSINWGVESDPMNFVYGIGILGATVFYWWLLKVAIMGRKINKLYFYMILCLAFSGIFYCIQYSFVIVVEVALTVSIHRKLDIFKE